MGAAATREFDLPSNLNCGIPATAAAYSLNVTVVPSEELRYLSVWQAGQNQPVVSTLNSDGRVKANAAIVPAGTNGGVNVFTSDETHVIIDINGYFQPAGSTPTLAFYPMTPCRVADTRNSGFPIGLGTPSLAAGVQRTFQVLQSNCAPPSTARAYSLNFTVVPAVPVRFMAAWPSGVNQPVVSTLNTSTTDVTANAAIVPAGSDGAIQVFSSDPTDLVIDINGYFAPLGQGGLALYTVTPCRTNDTRSTAPLNGQAPFQIAGSQCGVPSTAQAFVLNATVVPGSDLGYLTLYPNGAAQPEASTLNASDEAITSNMAIVPTTDGKVAAFASSSTDLILDVTSYFAP